MNQIEFNNIGENSIKNQDINSLSKNKENFFKSSFNRTTQGFSSFKKEENQNILYENNKKNPENFFNISNVSGNGQNITNNINIKNVNIINCNESSFFNNVDNNNSSLLFDRVKVNNNLKNNNILGNNINNSYFDQNQYINFSSIIENNKKSDFQKYNKKSCEANKNFIKNENLLNLYNNNSNDFNRINLENNNKEQSQFLNYISNLRMPLTKFLSTKKGICEMENYLNMTMNKDISLLLQLLNKEGLTKLMKNKFGNYFIQDIVGKANPDQIELILTLISEKFIEISENISGTYVIQRLLDKINNFKLRFFVLKLIENRELEMAFNNNATYVLQKIIEKVPDIERINLNEIIINNTFFLSLNPDCVFIVEKFIDTITIIQNKIRIQNVIFLHCLQLSNNPYGNYLIQYVLKSWKNEEIQNIYNIIIENSNFMVQQRYASNVIEKCFEIFDDKNRKRLVKSMCLGGNILDIIKNQYGHYVLNKTIKYIDEDAKIEIEKKLNNKMPEMSKKEKSKSKKFISILKNEQPKKKEKNIK